MNFRGWSPIKILEIPGGRGGHQRPPGTENPGGWGGANQNVFRGGGGLWIFSGTTQYKSTTLAKLLFCFLSLLFFDVLVNVWLSLSVAPRITSDGTDQILKKGQKFTLECEATGSPTPTVVWKRNGQIDPRQKVISYVFYVLCILTGSLSIFSQESSWPRS